MSKKLGLHFIVALAVGLMALPVGPVRADAATATDVDIAFTVSGTLPTFPCNFSCTTPFAGMGNGTGAVTGSDGTDSYRAAFAVVSAALDGSADYDEPGLPYCPSIGSAAGTAHLAGLATGVVNRSSTPAVNGVVTGIDATLNFTFERVGAVAVIAVLGGSMTVSYAFSDTGAGSFTTGVVAGGGPAAFTANPVDMALDCLAPGSMGYTVIGDVAVATG